MQKEEEEIEKERRKKQEEDLLASTVSGNVPVELHSLPAAGERRNRAQVLPRQSIEEIGYKWDTSIRKNYGPSLNDSFLY